MEKINKRTLDEISVLKAIAIIGVVIVHMDSLLINLSVVNLVNGFHMPTFMFASGFLYGYSRFEITSVSAYCTFVSKKFKRLLIPYFVWFGILTVVKYFGGKFLSINYPVENNFLTYMIFDPIKSHAAFLWYLHVLFQIFLIFPLINKLIRNQIVLGILILSLYCIEIPSFVYFHHELFRMFLMFFYPGYLIAFNKSELFHNRHKLICIVVSTICVLLYLWGDTISDNLLSSFIAPYSANMLIRALRGISGALTIYSISIYLNNNRNVVFHSLKQIGIFSSSIYLMHTLFLAVGRLLFINLLNMDKNYLPFSSIVILLFGIILPILATKYFINKFVFLPPLILGVRK